MGRVKELWQDELEAAQQAFVDTEDEPAFRKALEGLGFHGGVDEDGLDQLEEQVSFGREVIAEKPFPEPCSHCGAATPTEAACRCTISNHVVHPCHGESP